MGEGICWEEAATATPITESVEGVGVNYQNELLRSI
jgi:hypothetical protein